MAERDEADLMTILLGLKAHVDQLAAELHDPLTGQARLQTIRLELRELLDLLKRFLDAHSG